MALAGFLFLAGILFYLFAFPVWMLVHCAGAEGLSKKAKAFWIVSILLLGPVGGAFYGFFVSKKTRLRWFSGLFFVLCAVFVVLFFFSMSYLTHTVPKMMSETIVRLDHLGPPNLSPEDQARLRTSVETLREEMKGPWSQTAKKEIAWALYNFLVQMIQDNQLTPAEYQDWMNKFNSRNILDPKALQEAVRALQK